MEIGFFLATVQSLNNFKLYSHKIKDDWKYVNAAQSTDGLKARGERQRRKHNHVLYLFLTEFCIEFHRF